MKKTLKLSVVLEKHDLSKHSLDLISWCATNENIELVCLIWEPDQPKSFIGLIENFFWNVMLFIEGAQLNIKKMHRHDVLRSIEISPKPKEFYLIQGDHEVVNEIKKLEIDLHLALNAGTFLEALKNNATYGALSFTGESFSPKVHNPYFFNEVLNKINNTEFKILHHHPTNEKTYVAQKGALPTHGYFLANRENVLLRQNFYMQRQIEAVMEKNIGNEEMLDSSRVELIKRAPFLYDQCKYLLQLLSLLSKRLFSLFKAPDLWNVGIYKGGWRAVDFKKAMVISNPKNHFLADPFVINKNGKDYCFVEDFDLKKSKGVIAVYEIGDDTVENVGLALEENFHLSFPYLFECDSKTYMLPETCDNKDIRLYKSIDFPLKWELSKIIKKDVTAVDSMIFKHENRWWLFTNINPIGGRDTCSELSLFYSDHPVNGDWLPHAKNPVIFDPSFARNGGIVIEEDCIYRIGQKQLFGTYGGGGFSVNKITELTPDAYQEEPALIIKPDFFLGNKGAHHFHTSGIISTFDFLT